MVSRKAKNRNWILGAPARPWFLKYAIGYFIFICIWFSVFIRQPDGVIARLLTALLFVGLVPLLWFHKETQRERQVGAFVRLGLLLLVCVIGAIIDEPWIGILLLVLGLAGILCTLIIRVQHRNDENSPSRITLP